MNSWRQQAMDKLPALVNATPMLACAEDLGMIPACVPQVLDQLQILSLGSTTHAKRIRRRIWTYRQVSIFKRCHNINT